VKYAGLPVDLVPQLNRCPREQKFVLGDRIETKLMEVQKSCLRAYYGREKRSHLIDANMRLEVTRHLIRLAHALRYFCNHTYAVLSEKVDTVGRMIGGWLRSVQGSDGMPSRAGLGNPAYNMPHGRDGDVGRVPSPGESG
jgi:hypothetical protein